MGVYLFMWGKHETVELWQKTKPYFPCQDLDLNKMAPWAKPRLNKNEEVNWIFRFVSWSYTIITSDPFMNTFINFHLACLTKEAWMNALSIASLFPQERSRTLSNESKPCLSCLSFSLSAGGMLRHGCWGSLAVIIPPACLAQQHKGCKFLHPFDSCFSNAAV